jgi:hypothetical protein
MFTMFRQSKKFKFYYIELARAACTTQRHMTHGWQHYPLPFLCIPAIPIHFCDKLVVSYVCMVAQHVYDDYYGQLACLQYDICVGCQGPEVSGHATSVQAMTVRYVWLVGLPLVGV